MDVKTLKLSHRGASALRVARKFNRKLATQVTSVRLTPEVEAASRGGWLCFWVAGREVRVGPLTAEQAEKLAEDLAYEAI